MLSHQPNPECRTQRQCQIWALQRGLWLAYVEMLKVKSLQKYSLELDYNYILAIWMPSLPPKETFWKIFSYIRTHFAAWPTPAEGFCCNFRLIWNNIDNKTLQYNSTSEPGAVIKLWTSKYLFSTIFFFCFWDAFLWKLGQHRIKSKYNRRLYLGFDCVNVFFCSAPEGILNKATSVN